MKNFLTPNKRAYHLTSELAPFCDRKHHNCFVQAQLLETINKRPNAFSLFVLEPRNQALVRARDNRRPFHGMELVRHVFSKFIKEDSVAEEDILAFWSDCQVCNVNAGG